MVIILDFWFMIKNRDTTQMLSPTQCQIGLGEGGADAGFHILHCLYLDTQTQEVHEGQKHKARP